MNELPTTLNGEPLDHNCLHCQLALPIKHFMARHPDKSKELIVKEMVETLAELLAVTGDSWSAVESYGRQAVYDLEHQTRVKYRAHLEHRRKAGVMR